MKKLDQATFRGEGWQLVTDSQAIASILKAIAVKDDEYRSMYVLTGVDEAVVSVPGSTSCWKYGRVGTKNLAVTFSLVKSCDSNEGF